MPPWGFWLGVAMLVIGGLSGMINLRFDVEALKAWRAETTANRFTDKDAAALMLQLQKEIEIERAFVRSLCNEVTRLARELGRVPANDCDRP